MGATINNPILVVAKAIEFGITVKTTGEVKVAGVAIKLLEAIDRAVDANVSLTEDGTVQKLALELMPYTEK